MPFDILVTVQDAFNNPATGYVGTVDFMLSPGGDLGTYTFTADDQGQHVLVGLVLDAGDYTLLGTDLANAAVVGSVAFTVTPPVLVPRKMPTFPERVTVVSSTRTSAEPLGKT